MKKKKESKGWWMSFKMVLDKMYKRHREYGISPSEALKHCKIYKWYEEEKGCLNFLKGWSKDNEKRMVSCGLFGQ